MKLSISSLCVLSSAWLDMGLSKTVEYPNKLFFFSSEPDDIFPELGILYSQTKAISLAKVLMTSFFNQPANDHPGGGGCPIP